MERDSRIERARARARTAKRVIGLLAAAVFGLAFVGAKANAPGHAKGTATSLRAPASFGRAVRRSVAQGGQIAPPVQAPPVSSSTS